MINIQPIGDGPNLRKIGFIGAGKMARALAGGLLRRDADEAREFELICSSQSAESGAEFVRMCRDLGVGRVEWVATNARVVEGCEGVVLGVKPQQLREVLAGLGGAGKNSLFLSLAAGVNLERLKVWLPEGARVVRTMPNLPTQIGLGASVYCVSEPISTDDEDWVQWILSAVGTCWKVNESQMNAVTALAGSGPAYVFHFLDVLEKAGQDLGLPHDLARDLAIQTVYGSAVLAHMSGIEPMDLAKQVKSPKGTTLAGCAVLEENDNLLNLMRSCLRATRDRAQQLEDEAQNSK